MEDNSLNISFTGEYNNSIDQKNRLSIPAKYRKALSPVNNGTGKSIDAPLSLKSIAVKLSPLGPTLAPTVFWNLTDKS